MTETIHREAILPRIDGIRRNLKKLEELAKLDFEVFCQGDALDLAQHHLRMALEGVFHLSSHILARLPGGRAIEYKELSRKMGELGIVPADFAEKKLVPMAGMRNMLVHFYSDIDKKRFYEVIRNHRKDIEAFLNYVGDLLKNPEKFDLRLE